MIQPVFVIGKNRSGTKWVSNIIASNSNVACIQRPGASGVLETNMLYNMPRVFGDLSVDDNYIAFARCFSATNFFKILDVEEGFLYENRCDDYFSIFRKLMDLHAKRNDKEYWVQKTSPHVLHKLNNYYPEARFILIKRNILDNIISTIGLKLNEYGYHKASLFREVLRYTYQYKIMKEFEDYENVLVINFEGLINEKVRICKRISKFIGIKYEEKMLYNEYEKNTSYSNNIKKENILSDNQERAVFALHNLTRCIPLSILRKMRRVKNKLGVGYHYEVDARIFQPKTFEMEMKENDIT
jgi:hypothetical protein